MALAAGLMLVEVNRSGYGNAYYAAGALAASHSWSAMLTNAADLGGYVSLDKGPLPDWLQGLSGRLLGFGSFSVMLPEALYGIATVVVLYDAVRRALGWQVAILAALIVALTPVAVLVGRYNSPDALLLLLLVCAAWSLTVAIQTGRPRELLLCAMFVGLAFNTKMLEAYLALPAFAAAYLVSRRAPMCRRAGELAVAASLALLVSGAWFGSMTLVPTGDRPYVGDSTDNSWFQLIIEGNGLQRVAGNSGAFAHDLESNLLYISSAHVAGQIAWLLPLALIGLVLGLLTTWRSRRASVAFGGYIMWGLWMLVGLVVLSFSAGARHAYYTSVLAPAVATLSAAALVTLWRSARASSIAALGLAFVLAASAVISSATLADSANFLPWLKWVVLVGGAVAGATVIAPHLHRMFRKSVTTAVSAGAATVALLAGPASYSVATATRSHTGYDPTAGPSLSQSKLAAASSRSAVRAAASSSTVEDATVAVLVPYLLAHRGHARFLVAATDATTAAPIALATGEPVITIGGFSGSDPTPSDDQLERLIGSRQLRYVVLDASRVLPTSMRQRAISASTWVEGNCSRVPDASIVSASRSASPRVVSKLTLFACGSVR